MPKIGVNASLDGKSNAAKKVSYLKMCGRKVDDKALVEDTADDWSVAIRS